MRFPTWCSIVNTFEDEEKAFRSAITFQSLFTLELCYYGGNHRKRIAGLSVRRQKSSALLPILPDVEDILRNIGSGGGSVPGDHTGDA
jgi:hypothetical protein